MVDHELWEVEGGLAVSVPCWHDCWTVPQPLFWLLPSCTAPHRLPWILTGCCWRRVSASLAAVARKAANDIVKDAASEIP